MYILYIFDIFSHLCLVETDKFLCLAFQGLEGKAKRDRARSALGTGRQHACGPSRSPYLRVFYNDHSKM